MSNNSNSSEKILNKSDMPMDNKSYSNKNNDMMNDKRNDKKNNKKNTLPVMKRLLGYVLKNYKFSCIAVVACILASSLITLTATLFIQKLVDNYIIPLTQSAVHDYAPLASAIIKLSAVLLVGVLCSYI